MGLETCDGAEENNQAQSGPSTEQGLGNNSSGEKEGKEIEKLKV